MRVLAISGSPRKNGNTDILLGEALDGARTCGADADFIALRDWNISACDGCRTCGKTGRCHINDEMQQIYEKLLAADGIVFGTPVQFWSMTGAMKVMIDRTESLRLKELSLANKVGGVVTVSSRTGGMTTASIFYLFFAANHMFATDYVQGFGTEKGDVRRDRHAVKAAFELGRQISSMIGQMLVYPSGFPHPIYRQVSVEHGIPINPVAQALI